MRACYTPEPKILQLKQVAVLHCRMIQAPVLNTPVSAAGSSLHSPQQAAISACTSPAHTRRPFCNETVQPAPLLCQAPCSLALQPAEQAVTQAGH